MFVPDLSISNQPVDFKVALIIKLMDGLSDMYVLQVMRLYMGSFQ